MVTATKINVGFATLLVVAKPTPRVELQNQHLTIILFTFSNTLDRIHEL